MKATSIQRDIAGVLSHLNPGVRTRLHESVADDLGVARRSVERALARFEAFGLITWQRKSPGGSRRPWWDVIVLNPEQLCVLSESAGAQE